MKRVIRLDKPVTVLLLFWSHKCDFGAEPRSRIIATLAVKGLNHSCIFFVHIKVILLADSSRSRLLSWFGSPIIKKIPEYHPPNVYGYVEI
jgi:hypothetical protein